MVVQVCGLQLEIRLGLISRSCSLVWVQPSRNKCKQSCRLNMSSQDSKIMRVCESVKICYIKKISPQSYLADTHLKKVINCLCIVQTKGIELVSVKF